MCVIEREGESQRQRYRDRERERETERQRETETERDRDRERERESEGGRRKPIRPVEDSMCGNLWLVCKLIVVQLAGRYLANGKR